ncbi:oligosaccharide flippase family protein [Marinobacter sp. M3C]|uniref:lipopolysaccharide biosynthesis protein n=1 Tax=Marinobacter sp. M3C TaxID=2917715 RepID=UPI00200E1C3A|nr:oligosaccharide flippase family protein [Marinobacter sp. M3C]MCL1477302.1 oligosaccharide flippase family protein [Marinobacter sp.]UQG61798.1 oligosaccharide flippase family protein [Marinobacter sp. M3C]
MSFKSLVGKFVLSQQFVALCAQGAKVALLAVYLVLSARSLGAEGYGYVVVAVSIASLFVQFVGLGSGIANVREAARDPATFSAAWGLALVRYVVSGMLLGSLYLSISFIFTDDVLTSEAWFLVAVSEILLLPLCMVTAYAFMAYGMVRLSLLTQIVAPALKAIALTVFFFHGEGLDVEAYAALMVLSTFIAASMVMVLAFRLLPPIIWPNPAEVWKIRSDILYSVNSLTNQGVAEGSKPLTMTMAGVGETGAYGAAMRIVAAASMPITSVIQSQAFRLFGYGKSIQTAHFVFFSRYAVVFLAYSFFCLLLLWLLSGYFGEILGPGFESIDSLILILAFWLPAFAIRQLIGAALTTTDKIKVRIYLDLASILFFLCLGLYLIPEYGPIGTAVSVVSAEFFWCFMAIISFKISRFR